MIYRINPARAPPVSSTPPLILRIEPSLVSSGDHWISCWTSKAEPTTERVTEPSGRGLSPSGPRDVGYRAQLPGEWAYQCSTDNLACAMFLQALWGNRHCCMAVPLRPTRHNPKGYCTVPRSMLAMFHLNAHSSVETPFGVSLQWCAGLFYIFRCVLILQESLPTAIGGWKNLRRLDLANNRLEDIPHEVNHR